MMYTPHQILFGYQTKEDEMD